MARAVKPVALGDEVQDVITGLKGVVACIGYHMSGSVQCGLVPKGNGKDAAPKGQWVDIQQLKRLGDGPLKPTPLDDTSQIVLGTTGLDVATGLTGTIVEKMVSLNGCTHLLIQPPVSSDPTKSGELPDRVQIDWKRIEVIDQKVKVAMPATPGKTPGGPSRDMGMDRGA